MGICNSCYFYDFNFDTCWPNGYRLLTHKPVKNTACKYFSEEKMSEKIEITVKVNDKVVPLSTISTETFEKIKKAEEEKNIPVATVCDYQDGRRLLLKLPPGLKYINNPDVVAVAIDLENCEVTDCSSGVSFIMHDRNYRNKQTVK